MVTLVAVKVRSEKKPNHLMATQADVEQVKVLGAFRGETRPDGQGGHAAHGTEVKGQRVVGLGVGEGAVAVAQRVFLKEKDTRDSQ